MKQTAVEWFFWKLYVLKEVEYESIMELYEQARAMEKEQIIESFSYGVINHHDAFKNQNKFGNGEQYYKETYEQDKQG